MERSKLELEARDTQKPKALRRSGRIPATLYGPDSESTSLQINRDTFVRLPLAAYSHVIELGTPSGVVQALIRQVHRKHVTNEILNVEFYRVANDRKLTVTVPLKFIGVSPAVAKGGQLVEMFQTADLECLPGDIPDYIEVNIGIIEDIDHGIHFSDLKAPS